VIEPRTPGFGESTPTDDLIDLHDLLYVWLDILDGLDVRDCPLVGHSLGGMFAAELAAMQPDRFSHLVLISPFGLFEVEDPVPDFFTYRPPELAAAMYHDPNSENAKAQHTGPGALTEDPDPNQLIEFQLERAKSLGQTAKWLWPIPNRGLNRRLHRISAPTLIIWGAEDGIVPPSYADRFQAAIPNARVERIADAAHQVPVDQPEAAAKLIREFIKS
jgi:pimeloyl-ACP methyl ester carboxylesterase